MAIRVLRWQVGWEKMSASRLSDIIQHFEVNEYGGHNGKYLWFVYMYTYPGIHHAINSHSQAERTRDLSSAVRYLVSDVTIASTIRACVSLQVQQAEVRE